MSLAGLPHQLRRSHVSLVLISGIAIGGCSRGPTEPSGPPSISIRLNPSGASIARNASVEIAVTLTRGGGFTGPVTLGVLNMPSSVLASFSPMIVPENATTSTLTLRAGPATGFGNNTVTVVGFGAGGVRGETELTFSIVAATPQAISQ